MQVFLNAISNSEGANKFLENAKKVVASDKVKQGFEKLLKQTPNFIEATVENVETQLSELKVKDLTSEIKDKIVNGDESGIAHKLVNENEGQGILSDLKESKAVQHLTANARTTISEVKGKVLARQRRK